MTPFTIGSGGDIQSWASFPVATDSALVFGFVGRASGSSVLPVIFFPVTPLRRNKNAKSGKNHQKNGCRKVGVQENKCWSQESRISNIRLYHRILYVSKICLPGLHGFPNKVGVQEKNLWANLSNRRG